MSKSLDICHCKVKRICTSSNEFCNLSFSQHDFNFKFEKETEQDGSKCFVQGRCRIASYRHGKEPHVFEMCRDLRRFKCNHTFYWAIGGVIRKPSVMCTNDCKEFLKGLPNNVHGSPSSQGKTLSWAVPVRKLLEMFFLDQIQNLDKTCVWYNWEKLDFLTMI